jgi:Fe-S-cluster containining protein
MGTPPFNCRRCGHCCLTLVDAFAGCVSEADLARWRAAGRLDILSRIESLDLGRGNILHLAWVDPLTRDDVERCPWLSELPDGGGFGCTIEAIKPDHCRAYPEDESHARQTGCPGAAFPPLPEK